METNISLPKALKLVKQISPNRAILEIEELHPGYGLTIGNALRRVMLSSLAGAAVTSIKIKDVSHEFSTLPGIIEDVVEMILNLKQKNDFSGGNHKSGRPYRHFDFKERVLGNGNPG